MASPSFSTAGNTSPHSAAAEAADSYEAIKEDIAALTVAVKKLATEQMGPAVTGAQDQMKQKIGEIESSIRKNPTQAALIAAGVGFLAGLVLSR
ncbi:MAG: hypothetical protein ABL894_10005 [Hyphomicrobium sp.]